MWALLDEKIVNKEFCRKSPSDGNKWQYQDNFFSLPDAVSAKDELVPGDFILEISQSSGGKHTEKG